MPLSLHSFTMVLSLLLYLPTTMQAVQATVPPTVPPPGGGRPVWTHLSTATGELPVPSSSTQQTASLILDIDNDNVNDVVIGTRQGTGPSLVWFKYDDKSWQRYVIEDEVLSIEAGGAYDDMYRVPGEWASILSRSVESIIETMLDPSGHARELRHVTPFAGVLSSAERASVYQRFSEQEHRS